MERSDSHYSKLVINLSITSGPSHAMTLKGWHRKYRTLPILHSSPKCLALIHKPLDVTSSL